MDRGHFLFTGTPVVGYGLACGWFWEPLCEGDWPGSTMSGWRMVHGIHGMGLCCVVAFACAVGVAAWAEDGELPDPSRPLKVPVGDLCTLSVADGKLVWNTRLQGYRLISQPIESEELPGTTTLTTRPRYFRLEHTFPSDGPLAGVSIKVYSRYSEDRIEVNTPQYSAEFRQSEHSGARLSVYDSSYASVVNVSADDFESLRKENPAAVIQFMGPVFRALRTPGMFGVDERLARRALIPGRPAAEVHSSVERLVRDLGSPSLEQRRQASARLRELGQDAYATLEKVDRWQLTPHQITEIDALLKDTEGISAAKVKELGADAAFLLDCCYCDDQAIRAEAVRRLRKLAGEKMEVSIDAKADPLSQAKAIEALRAALVKPPATRPAKPAGTELLKEPLAE